MLNEEILPMLEEAEAYWLSPYGNIIQVHLSHINTVISEPSSFGLTDDEIKAAYKKHNEKMNLEGKARKEIMTKLVEMKWIRIRFYTKEYAWTIELSKLTKKVKNRIYAFSLALLKLNERKYKYSNVKIIEFASNFDVTYLSVNEIANGGLFSEAEKNDKSRIQETIRMVHNANELLQHLQK